MASATLRSKRHILTTLAVLAFMSTGAFAVVGFAAASDVSTGFTTLAAPMAGDVVEYNVTSPAGEPRPWDTDDVPYTFRLEWQPDQELRHPDGTLRLTNMVRISEDRPDDRHDRDSVWEFIPGTGDSVAMGYIRQEATEQEDGETLYVESQTRHFQAREDGFPCGIRTGLQGSTVAFGPVIKETIRCRGSGVLIDAGDPLRVVGHDPESGIIEVEARDDRRDEWMVYVFDPEIPYPLRIEEHDDGLQRLWEMTGFVRGTEPVAHAPQPATPSPLAPLVMTSPKEYGFDATGVDHPFPPDEAWELAKQTPESGLSDFLATHPGAYAASIYYGNLRSANSDWDYWRFDVADEDEILDFSIRIISDQRTSILGNPLPLPGEAQPADDVTASYRIDPNEGRYPAPGHRPDRLPTWASMLAQWEAYRGPDYADETANSYSLHLSCDDENCTKVSIITEAGFIQYDRSFDAAGRTVDDLRFSDLQWRQIPGRDDYTFDAPTSYHEQTQAWRPLGTPAPTRTSEPGQLQPVAASVWAVPSIPEAAAVGGVAILAAVAYYLSPLVKSGIVGGFSRIQGAKVMEHPARQKLMQVIEADPGVHHQQLVRRTGGGKGATDMHLRRLESAGMVTVARSRGYTCYFPQGTDYRVASAAGALKAPVAQKLFSLAKDDGVLLADVRRELGVAASTLHHHMKRLESAGLIEVERVGNGKRVRATPLAQMAA